MNKPVIGFIGLGIMGKPMARNLLKAGYSLIVHNRSRASVDELSKEGAQTAASSQEVAARSEVVITMLPDSPDVELVYIGEQGVFAGAKPSAVERAMPIFQVLGKNIVHVGDAGAGQVTKAANQMVVGTTIAIVSEALVLAAKAGVDPAKVRQALLGGFAQSKILEAHGQKMLERNFKPGFRIRLHEKDMKIALATGAEYGVPLMVTSQVAQMMTAMRSMGNGELDHAGLVALVEQLSKTELS